MGMRESYLKQLQRLITEGTASNGRRKYYVFEGDDDGSFSVLTEMLSSSLTKSSLSDVFNGWFYAAITKTAYSVAKQDWWVFDRVKNEVVYEHPFLELFSRPNKWQSRFQFMEFSTIVLLCHGAVYWLKLRGENTRRVRELIPLTAKQVSPVIDDKEGIVAYRVLTTAGYTEVPVSEICAIRLPHYSNMFATKSYFEAVQKELQLLKNIKAFELSFTANNLMPSYALTIEPDAVVDEDDARRLIRGWRNAFRSKNPAGEVAVLPPGVKPVRLNDYKEIGFIEGRKVLRDEILGALGVPASVLGIAEDVNRANAEANKYVFAENVVEPMLVRFQDAINTDLGKEFGIDGVRLVVEFESPIPDDKDYELNVAKFNIQEGITTINEERARQGLPPIEGGDVRYVRAIYIPVPVSESGVDENDEDEDKSFIKDVKKKITTKSLVNDITALFDYKGFLIEAEEIGAQYVIGAAQSGMAMAYELAGYDAPEELAREAAEIVIAANVKTAKDITDTTLDYLKQTLAKGIEAGEDFEALTGRVMGLFEDMSYYRAERIARTETMSAYNTGNFFGYRGIGAPFKEWITAIDERTREWHIQADGQVVPVEEFFVVNGETLMYPGDRSNGASAENIVNCRCTSSPVWDNKGVRSKEAREQLWLKAVDVQGRYEKRYKRALEKMFVVYGERLVQRMVENREQIEERLRWLQNA